METVGEVIRVLDKGSIQLVDFMGSDQGVVRAARVSHKSSGDDEKDKRLIAYLWEHRHTTPFEHSVMTWHVKCPILVMRQWIRHRMSSYNETSFRYREVPDEFYYPEQWRLQDTKNKQGSMPAPALEHRYYSTELAKDCEHAMAKYKEMIAVGIAREMARMVIPVNVYTEFYWTVNAHAFLHFIGLRSESHAQWETRQYSDAMWGVFESVMPWTAKAFLCSINKRDPAAYPGINNQDAVARRIAEAT